MKTIIKCPICDKKVLTYDGKSKTPMDVKCRTCNVLVTFIPENQSEKVSKVPMRNTSSGTRFY